MTEKTDEERAEDFAAREHDTIFGGKGLVHPAATIAIYLAGLREGRRLERERMSLQVLIGDKVLGFVDKIDPPEGE